MADSFDPYHKWLGISPKDQPPHHYRLLALELFEDDPDVIESAADQRMAHVRTFQTGQNSALSQRILNELSAAKLCLLNPQKKAEYDRQLREKVERQKAAGGASAGAMHGTSAPAARPVPKPAMPVAVPLPASPVLVSGVPSTGPSVRPRASRKRPPWRQPAVLGTAGALVLFAAVAYWLTAGGTPKQQVAAKKDNEFRSTEKRNEFGSTDERNEFRSTDTAEPSVEAPAVPKAKNASVDPQPPDRSTNPPTVQSATAGGSAVEPPADQPDFEILEAKWGVGDQWVNVTEGVRKLVRDNRLMMMVWSNLFGSPEDPAKGTAKSLRIQYRSRGQVFTAEYPDFFFVYLDGNPLAPPTNSPDGLELLEARYGAGTSYVDVLPQLRQHLRNGRLAVAADQFAASTEAELAKQEINSGTFKVLWARYRNATGEHFIHVWNTDLLVIDSRRPAAAGEAVDLLKLIDPDRDSMAGTWKFNGASLVAPAVPHPRLEIPYEPPEEYALTLVCDGEPTRDAGVGLVVGGHQALAAVDGLNATASGISLVDGAWGHSNPSCHWRCGPMFEQGRPNTLLFVVRRTSVNVYRDGAELIRWSGNPASLSLPADWLPRDARRLFLKTHEATLRISKLELVPLAPEKSPLLIAGESGDRLDVLGAIDLDRDLLRGDWQHDGRSLTSPDSESALLQVQLPAILPSEYRMIVVAQREAGNDCLMFTLPVGGTHASLLIDGGQGTTAGMQMVDDKDFMGNETTRKVKVFADGQPHTITVIARKNRVRLASDGTILVDWTGDVSRLKSSQSVRYPDRAYLGTWSSRFRLTKIELTRLSGDANNEPPTALAGKVESSPLDEPGAPTIEPRPRTLADLASDNPTNSSRPAAPDEETLKKARPEMKKKYASLLKAARSPEQKRRVAEQLAQKAGAAGGAEAYVLWTQAIDLAEAAGDLDLAWLTVDRFAQAFAVDRLSLRIASLADIGKGNKSPEHAWTLSDAACRLMVSALTAGDAAAVKKAGTQAQSFARRMDRSVQKDVTDRAADAAKLAEQWPAVVAARETLKTSPVDPQANFTVGHYEVCAAGDWSAALPKLAKCGETTWKQLAADDLALGDQSVNASRRSAVADGWWSLAESEPWPGRHYLRMRAARHYRLSNRGLVGDSRPTAVERLRTLLAVDDGLPNWDLFQWRVFPRTFEPTGEVARVESNGNVETAADFVGPIDVLLIIRTSDTKFRLTSHRWSWNWDFLLVPDQWHTLRYVINPLSRTVFVDGVLAQTETWRTPRQFNAGPVSFNVNDDSVVEVRKFIVKSLE